VFRQQAYNLLHGCCETCSAIGSRCWKVVVYTALTHQDVHASQHLWSRVLPANPINCAAAAAVVWCSQVRSIQFNLKDAKNPDLRRRVMTGEIDPQVCASSAALLLFCIQGLSQGLKLLLCFEFLNSARVRRHR
jgi:hypothetical protein